MEGSTGNFILYLATDTFVNKKIGQYLNFGLHSWCFIPIDKTTKWTTNGIKKEDDPLIHKGFIATLFLVQHYNHLKKIQ